MILREWTEGDLPKISEMERAYFDGDAWTEKMLLDTMSSPFSWTILAEEGGQVCGYACLFVLFEEAEVQNIAVDIPFRKQGYGDKLLAFLHDFAKEQGAEISFLEVRVSNAAAIGLYRKHGYEIYGERSRYYPDGESAYVMRKSL